MERFLYRLSRSQFRDAFILKGALLLSAWRAPQSRPTMDIDLMGRTEGLLVGQSSISIGILLNQRRSGVIDRSEFHGVPLVHGPELGCLAVRECEICGNELLLDRADVLAQQRHLLIRKGVSASGSRSARLRSCVLSRDSWRSEYTGSKKCDHNKRDFLHSRFSPRLSGGGAAPRT